jgi:hypothetical protein
LPPSCDRQWKRWNLAARFVAKLLDKHSSCAEVGTLDGFAQRLDDGHAGVDAREGLHPFLGGARFNDRGDGVANPKRVTRIVQQMRRIEHAQEVFPELLLEPRSSAKRTMA